MNSQDVEEDVTKRLVARDGKGGIFPIVGNVARYRLPIVNFGKHQYVNENVKLAE